MRKKLGLEVALTPLSSGICVTKLAVRLQISDTFVSLGSAERHLVQFERLRPVEHHLVQFVHVRSAEYHLVQFEHLRPAGYRLGQFEHPRPVCHPDYKISEMTVQLHCPLCLVLAVSPNFELDLHCLKESFQRL